MKLIFKIGIGLVVVAGVFLIWAFKAAKVRELEVAEGDSQSSKVKKADEWLQKIHKEKKFNGGVLVIKNGEVLLKKTYGYTDHTQKEQLTSASAFRLASVSKQFTATGIMLLKEQGKLDFDDPITKYLPELKYNNVSIRNLLNHTSGVPDVYMNFPNKYSKEIGDVLEISEMVTLLAKEDLPLRTKPNAAYQYNNTGYVLLAAIIESVSQKSFEKFMQEELFDLLQMKNTRVWNLVSKDKDFDNKTSSFSYFMGSPNKLTPGVLDGVAGDGSVFSSLDDFIIWNQFWSKNDLLSKETMAEAFKRPTLEDGKQSFYGFGWIVTNGVGVWHNGSWLGARTLIARNEATKNCIVVLDNSSSKSVDLIGQQLAKILQ